MASSSSSANRKIRLTDESYIMIGLHASKYPEQPVLGFLLGTEVNDQYNVSEILPVCHSVPAGPILELSAELAERSANKVNNKVLGLYYGLEYGPTAIIPPYIERIISNLKTILGHQTIVLQFKNNLLGDVNQLYVEGSLVSGAPVKVESITPTTALIQHFANCITSNRQLLLCDFEEHMSSDSFGDYLNKELIGVLKTV